MGDPRRLKKKFKKPRNPFERERILEELDFIGKYGLRNKHKKGKLKISVTKDSNVHIIQVEDNGPGFNSDSKIIKGTGKGLSILDELIELYYKLEKIRITYSLKNVEIGSKSKTGTIAVINIPS